jgi:hypothetical protein
MPAGELVTRPCPVTLIVNANCAGRTRVNDAVTS